MRFLPLLALVSSSLLFSGCLDQYNPKRYYAQWNREYTQSKIVLPKLSATGELPPEGGPAINPDEIFATNCSTCHGNDGHGNGPGAVALNPKPRNFHDQAWQAKTDDKRIENVIKNGGAANGLSASMPPWGAVLSDAQIDAVVKKIRAFGKQP